MMPKSVKVTIPAEAFERLRDIAELDQKQLRITLGLLAFLAGEGGDEAVARVFGADIDTVRSGREAFEAMDAESAESAPKRAGAAQKVASRMRRENA